jgi:hypothetical protein
MIDQRVSFPALQSGRLALAVKQTNKQTRSISTIGRPVAVVDASCTGSVLPRHSSLP